MNFFWNNYLPDPVIFELGPVSIRWYGLLLVTAIVVAAWYVRQQLLKKSKLTSHQIEDLFFYTIILSLIGARFGHVIFFNFSYYWNYPGEIIQIWNGGLSIQGALLFGLITVLVWSKKYNLSFWKLADVMVPAVALGQVIGRWGNYFNQELFGKPTTGWWGIPIEASNKVVGFTKDTYFQPTFFYESILNFVLFFTLHKLLQKKLKTGTIVLSYFAGYAVIRILMEFIRIDDTPVVWGIRLPQLISMAIILAVLASIYILYAKPLPKTKK
ncbi:prolipoprotein diacylglyceryl transferase [Candidatus Parcubacteria bacterium]|jgi:phosphatidylglycerol---prolipoprotein diacylglyceryl transferase|nr:prolipoprotein diacylglyceryl transferase [Candidatus Parcubacteria bacterium]